MGLDTKSINKLLKKLDALSSIESKKIVNEIAEDLAKVIKDKCPEDEGNSKKSVGIADVKEYDTGTYISVGFDATKDPFDEWKGAYFNNYGWNSGGKFHGKHLGWFDEAINSKEEEIISKMKQKLKEETKAFKEV